MLSVATIKKEICRHSGAVSDRKSEGLWEVGMPMEHMTNASLPSDIGCENFTMLRFLSNEPMDGSTQCYGEVDIFTCFFFF